MQLSTIVSVIMMMIMITFGPCRGLRLLLEVTLYGFVLLGWNIAIRLLLAIAWALNRHTKHR